MTISSGRWLIAAGAVFIADLLSPLGYAVPIFYVLVILLTWRMPGRQSTILVVGSALLLMWIGVPLSTGELTQEALTNRALVTALILIIAWLLIIHKESSRKIEKAQQDRNESEEQLRLVMSAVNCGTFDWDIPAQKVMWSAEMERICGLPIGGFEGTYEHWRRLVHPDDVGEAERIARLSLEHVDISYTFDHRIIRPDQTVRWIHVKAKTLRDAAGRPIRMLGLSLDITDRKQAEEALQRLNETLEHRVADRTAELNRSEEEARADLKAMTTLNELGLLSAREDTLQPVLEQIVDAAMAISGADLGNIQLLDPESGELKIVAQRGFSDCWVTFWNRMSKGQGVCGTALERGRRVIVEDVERSQIFADAAVRDIQLKAGVRAVQSTPLVSRAGTMLGMLSTHYKTPLRPNQRTLQMLDLLARQAADIIERTRAESALRVSEQRFRAFTHATNDVVYRMSADWTEMSFLQGRRFIPDTLEPSRTWLDKYIHPDDQPSVMETIQGAIQSKGVFELEHRVIRVDGSLGWVYSRAIPILDDRGEIVEWFGAASDVTQRKRAELDLSAAKSRLEAALASMTDAVLISDRDGCCIHFNEAFARFYRFRNQEECAKALHEFPAFLDVLLPDGEPAALDQRAGPRAFRGETAQNVEYELRRKDTGERWIGSYNFAPIRDGEGEIVGTVVVSRDVTQERDVSSALILRDTQLQDLTVRLITAQDEECRRIARDLHDDHMQRLAALALDLHHLSRSLPKPAGEAQAKIAQLAQTVEQLTTDLQQFAHQLHPSLLNHAGLEPTLREYVEEFEQRTGLKTKV